jgi:hypothetical protein
MLKRLWLVISCSWAGLILLLGLTDPEGFRPIHFEVAAFPFAAGAFLALVGRYVLTGSFRKSRMGVYRSPHR